MKKTVAKAKSKRIIRWPFFYMILFGLSVILVLSTVIWTKHTHLASEKSIYNLGEFYLGEITNRNTRTITSELTRKTKQMYRAVSVLDGNYLKNKESIRKYINMVQKMNGLDMLALVDNQGMVYTKDKIYSGASQFDFLSEKNTEPEIHLIKSKKEKRRVFISVPVVCENPAGIPIVSCFSELNVENIISAEQLQSFDNKTYCRLFTKSGENLINIPGEYQNEKNLFDIWKENTDFSEGYSLEKVKEDWKKGKEGYVVYNCKNAGNTYVYYKNVPDTELMLTSLMRESNISQVVKMATEDMVHSSTIYLVIVIVTLAALFFITALVVRNVRKNERENEQFKILGALSNDYSDIFIMDTLKDQSVTMKAKGKMVDYRQQKPHSYEQTWRWYVDKFVIEEDAKTVLEAIETENIKEELENQLEYIVHFRVKFKRVIHHFQCKFVKIIGENNRLIVGFRNIDAQMQTEMERQKALQNALASAQHANRAKTTFLNNMSHDIRTPMNAIIGFTSLAATHLDKPDQVRDYLTKIQTASSHLMSLINDVLDMSRIESGKVKIEEQEIHIPDLIHDIRTIVQADINSKQLELFIDAVDVFNENVICDKLRLNQILLNLLSNAMKFTKPGGMVSLRIIQTQDSRKGYARYEFRVKDNGIGMSKEFQEHIFEAFTREETSTVSGIQGTGLGMAITKSIVDIIGGTIDVKSEVGKGTEIIVCLPLRISGKPVPNNTIPELQGLKVLVADDDVNSCMSIASMLAVTGMRADWTTSGKEAVIRAQFAVNQKDEFNAYIIDWLMPDMNGIEVVRRIRHIIGDSKPIIILTAYDWSNIEEEAKEAGVTAFCSKPLFMSELRNVLTKKDEDQENHETMESQVKIYEGKKLLLVEDNELNREIAMEILGIMGFEIDIAVDGEEAVEKVKVAEPGQYDLILMDIQMPHMDGYEATKKIRGLASKEKANIPIIAMTANAFEEDRQNALAVGMNGHIAKPIEIPKMVDMLKNVLQ